MTGRGRRPEPADSRRQPARETWLSAQLRERIQRVLAGDRQEVGQQVHEPESLPQPPRPDPLPQPDLEAEP